MATM
jgi:hypothetical protein